MSKTTEEEVRETALRAVDFAEDKKALDVVLLEVGKLTHLADFFLLCTGTSTQHVQTIADSVIGGLEANLSLKPLRLEGYREAEWVLIDYGAVVVHIFKPDKREFYNLERLWGGTKT